MSYIQDIYIYHNVITYIISSLYTICMKTEMKFLVTMKPKTMMINCDKTVWSVLF